MGEHGAINAIDCDEANFLHARSLALENEWWEALIGTMQGLKCLYEETGRRAEWKRLVEEIVPKFVDSATGRPLPGRESSLTIITAYRAELAAQQRRWDEAESLHDMLVSEARSAAGEFADVPPQALNDEGRHALRNLGVALEQMALTRMAKGDIACESLLKEAGDIYERLGASRDAAYNAFNLAKVYVDFPEVRNLAEAERLFRKSLSLQGATHPRWRGVIAGELAVVLYGRFQEARELGRPQEELEDYLMKAQELCVFSLNVTPPNILDHLAVSHNTLGLIFSETPLTDLAVHHYKEAIRYAEARGDSFQSATLRYSAALTLYHAGKLPEAALYARSALRGLMGFGDAAAERTREVLDLIKDIEHPQHK